MKKLLFLACLAGLTAAVVTAGPLREEDIPADAKLLLHVDFDALRSSEIGQLVQSDLQSKYQEKIDALTELLGSDLTRDLYGVTFFGTGPDEKKGAILVNGSYNKEKLLALLVLNSAYSKAEYEGTTLHHWMDEKNNDEMYGAFVNDNLIVIGQTEGVVIDTLDVIAGRRQSLAAQPDSPLYKLCQTSDNPILMAAAVELSELVPDQEQAAILKNSKLAAFLAAEKGGNMTATLHLEANDEQAAIQVEQIARGLLAFAAMQNNGPLIQSVALTRDNNALDCSFSYPSADLFDLFKSDIHKNIELKIPAPQE